MFCRDAAGDWPEQEQYSGSYVPQWTHLALLAIVVLSIVYLFFDKKPQVFLKPQEWQELPLVAKEVRCCMGLSSRMHSCCIAATPTLKNTLMHLPSACRCLTAHDV